MHNYTTAAASILPLLLQLLLLLLKLLLFLIIIGPGLFCDGTRRYGVPAPFFQSKEKNICNVYYYRISDFRLVSTAPIT